MCPGGVHPLRSLVTSVLGHFGPRTDLHVHFGRQPLRSSVTSVLGTEVTAPDRSLAKSDRSSPKRGQPPIFRPFLLWQNGWMHEDATWYGGRPQPRRHCIRRGPSSPPLNGHSRDSPKFSDDVCCGQMAGWQGSRIRIAYVFYFFKDTHVR